MRSNISKFVLLSFMIFFFSQACNGFEKLDDGIVLQLKKLKETEIQFVKIQVCSDEIIHVLATHENSFSSRPSLMVDKKNWDPVPFSIKEERII